MVSRPAASASRFTNHKSLVISKKTKMSELINFRLKISTVDNRNFIGQLLSFDKHMNLVLADTEEHRLPKKVLQQLKNGSADTVDPQDASLKRNLGLIILRGEQIVSVVIEAGPVTDTKSRIVLDKGKGISRPLKTPVSVKSRVKPGFKRN